MDFKKVKIESDDKLIYLSIIIDSVRLRICKYISSSGTIAAKCKMMEKLTLLMEI